jgi:ABC-2 type transport system ATP-binding protein
MIPMTRDDSLPALAIETTGLGKRYGALRAVRGLDLAVPEGRFFGLLGPNGSGKTTTLHMLSTLVRPSEGRARVAGYDVLHSPVEVRRAIGLVFQESALDRTLTVMENLRFAAALYNLPTRTSLERIEELLGLFELGGRGNELISVLSGGMRRAVDIARGVLHRPRILFLDEPTIGLDVINRRAVWRFLNRLREEEGTTLILTTHYLEEAGGCDQVAFMKQGRVIGQDKPADLIHDLGAYILEVETEHPEREAARLGPLLGPPIIEGEHLLFRIRDPAFPLAEWLDKLRAQVQAVHLRKPDLNDVYIWLNRSNQGGD